MACRAVVAWPAALQALAARAAISLQALDGRRGRLIQVAVFCGHRCTATALSTWGMSTYPLATQPSRVVRMGETDEQLPDEKWAVHKLISSSWTSGKKGTGVGCGREPRPVLRNQSSCLEGSGLGGVHASSPMLAAAQESPAINSGSDSPNLRRIFILRRQLPITRCCYRHLILYRHAEWNAGHAVRRHSRITGELHRTAAVGGVKGPWGLARRKALTVTLRSPRALAHSSLLVTEGVPLIPMRRERRDRSAVMVTRSKRTHEPSTNAASACWMPRHWRQRSWLSTEDRKRPQPGGHGRNGVFKKSHRDANQNSFQTDDEWLCGDQHVHPLGSKAKIWWVDAPVAYLYPYAREVAQVCKIH